MEEKLSGMLAYLEPGNPGMHTTDTIDFEVVMCGEVILELDDGVENVLRPGHRGAERDAPPLEEPGHRAGRPGGVPHRGPLPRPVIELVRFLPTIWEAGNIRLAYGSPAKRSCVRAASRAAIVAGPLELALVRPSPGPVPTALRRSMAALISERWNAKGLWGGGKPLTKI